MAKLIWSPRALQDLDQTCEYIARDSARYAYIFAEGIVQFIEDIPANPLLGAVVPEYRNAGLRERHFQNYRIVYRVTEAAIEIVGIVHAARLMPSDLV